MENIKTNVILDAKGLACPMPIVKTKKAMNNLKAGQVLEVQATDKGSKADLKAWAESSGHQYLGTIEEGEVLKHYLRKSSNDETNEIKHPNVINNEDLERRLEINKNTVLLDVREAAEYAFNHIPNAISIPLGELEERMEELNKRVAIIASNGGLFDAYKVFNIATAAAATDQEVAIFFTFEGLNLIHKEANKQLPMPEGKEHFAEGFAKANVPSIPELAAMAQEMGVKFIGCQMTMDVMGLEKEDFMNGIEVGGAVTFLESAKNADSTLTF